MSWWEWMSAWEHSSVNRLSPLVHTGCELGDLCCLCAGGEGVRLAETEGADFRLPAEIARDEFIQRYLYDCDYRSRNALCLS